MTKNKLATTDLDLKSAFEELETLVTEFEQGDLDLEKSIPKFKRGLELSKLIKSRLAVIENEVTEIKRQFEDDDSELE